MDCIFCKIIMGEIPSMKIYDDDKVIAFLDINPDSAGHTLIISKEHYVTLDDIPITLLNHIGDVSKKMYNLILNELEADGITLVQNNGIPQIIKHYHLHLIPKYKEDKMLGVTDVYEMLKK